MGSQFTGAYEAMSAGLASAKGSDNGDWKKLLARARKLMAHDGFDVSEASLVSDLRKRIAKANVTGTDESPGYFECVGQSTNGAGPGTIINAEVAKRIGAIKTLRHTYFLKRYGSHKVWVISLPGSFTEWPHVALEGTMASAKTKLNDKDERFSTEARKHLAHASQEGLKWVHKALMVTGDPTSRKNFPIIARWFADRNSTDQDMVAAAATLRAGFKKIAARLKSGTLIYTDSVSERGTDENAFTEAFVWGDRINVVYIEEAFFGTGNTLSGLTNWARIVVHELTHREVATKDHAYEHQGMSPNKIGAVKALDNADSWAWFCADCGGALTQGVIDNALNR